jgi:hypothetical protein
MIERAKVDGLIEWVVPHLVDGGLSILQYADDTIIFTEHDLEKSRNLKLILPALEQLLVLKFNFHKSELFCLVWHKMRSMLTPNFLVVSKASFL